MEAEEADIGSNNGTSRFNSMRIDQDISDQDDGQIPISK
jgi:hypothetical protein